MLLRRQFAGSPLISYCTTPLGYSFMMFDEPRCQVEVVLLRLDVVVLRHGLLRQGEQGWTLMWCCSVHPF